MVVVAIYITFVFLKHYSFPYNNLIISEKTPPDRYSNQSKVTELMNAFCFVTEMILIILLCHIEAELLFRWLTPRDYLYCFIFVMG